MMDFIPTHTIDFRHVCYIFVVRSKIPYRICCFKCWCCWYSLLSSASFSFLSFFPSLFRFFSFSLFVIFLHFMCFIQSQAHVHAHIVAKERIILLWVMTLNKSPEIKWEFFFPRQAFDLLSGNMCAAVCVCVCVCELCTKYTQRDAVVRNRKKRN